MTFLLSHRCSLVKTALIFGLVIYLTDCAAGLEEIYMSDYCGSTASIRVDRSLVLHLSHLGDLPRKRADEGGLLHCGLSIAAKDHTNRLLLHIVRLHIDLKHTDRLHVYEVAGRKFHRLSPGPGLFGKYGDVVQIASDGITDYKTHGDTFYLDYEGFPTQEFSGFTIIFTEFHEVSGITGSCFGTFFACEIAHICIDHTLRCDGHRNCGEFDNSDETSCSLQLPGGGQETPEDSTVTIALSVGIVATLTFLLVSLSIFLVTRLRRRQMASSRRQSGATLEGSTPEQRTAESDRDLNTLYAPPSYDSLMLTSTSNLNLENPPPYDSLVSLHIEEITLPERQDIDESSFCSSPSASISPSLCEFRSNMAANKNGGSTESVPQIIDVHNEMGESGPHTIDTPNEDDTSES